MSPEFGGRVLELNMGLNHLGRSPANDIQIEHPTVSARHCEIVLAGDGLLLRDCESANGTFVGGERVTKARLVGGQTLRLGTVELLVETTEVNIAIPKFDMPRPAPPVVLADGSFICPRHPKAIATYQCTHCHEVLCDACMHRLRRRGGKLMRFCPLCSHPCVPLSPEKRKKKSLFGLWRKTVKLPFFRGPKQP
jgi:FHA domain